MVKYQGAYREELETDDAATQADPTATPNGTEANQTGPTLNPEERTYKARYDSLKAHYDTQINASRQRENSFKTQLAQASRTNIAMPKTEEELLAWRSHYPDLYGMLVTVIRQEFKSKDEEVNQRMATVEASALHARRERAEATLERLHPDFPELRMSEEFHKWVREQPKAIQDWLYENEDDPLLASKAIDLYKAEKGPAKTAQAKPQSVSSAATTVRTRNAKPELETTQGRQWKTSEISRLSRKDFDRFEADIDKARMDGRLIIDS